MKQEPEIRFENIDDKHVKVTANREGKLFEVILLLLSEKAAKSIEVEPARLRLVGHTG